MTEPSSSRISGDRVSVRPSRRLRVTEASLSTWILMGASRSVRLGFEGEDLLDAEDLGETRGLGAGPELVGFAVGGDAGVHQRVGRLDALHHEGTGVQGEPNFAADAVLAGFQEGLQIAGQGIEEVTFVKERPVEVAEALLPEELLAAEHQLLQLPVGPDEQVRGGGLEAHAALDAE